MKNVFVGNVNLNLVLSWRKAYNTIECVIVSKNIFDKKSTHIDKETYSIAKKEINCFVQTRI